MAMRNNTTDYLILGAGPAGLQLAYFLQQAGRDVLLLEGESSAGAFFKRFPRHRKLLSINKIHTGYSDRETSMRWDWNSLLGPAHDVLLSAYSREYFPHADALVRYLEEFAVRHELRLQCNTRVVSIGRRQDHGYWLRDQHGGVYHTQHLIVATGVSRPHLPTIEGVELAELYTSMSVDPHEYTDARVLIIGKGNSAFETADALTHTARSIHLVSPHPVEFAWRSHFPGHLRAVNNNFLDTYQLKAQNAVLDAHVEHIRREAAGFRVKFRYIHNDEVEELSYDRVLLCAGFRFDDSLFEPDCRPELRSCGRLPLMSEAWESTNLPGVFFAGTLTQAIDYKKSSSSFIHGFRYNARALFRMLELENHGVPWPHRSLPAEPEPLSTAILERVNRTAGLWQQFGFLCDVVSLASDADGGANYYEEVPLGYALERAPFRASRQFAVTLEYGPHKAVDPFNQRGRVARDDVAQAERSAFLHPVVRYYVDGRLQAVHHILEDLAAEWREHEHIAPLQEFLQAQLGASEAVTGTFPNDVPRPGAAQGG